MDNFKDLFSSSGVDGNLTIVFGFVVSIVLVIEMWKMFTQTH